MSAARAYNVFSRKGAKVLQLRIWAAPTGLTPKTKEQISELMDGLRVRPSRSPVTVSPVAAKTLGARALGRAILGGAADDFAAGTGVGSPHNYWAGRPPVRARVRVSAELGGGTKVSHVFFGVNVAAGSG